MNPLQTIIGFVNSHEKCRGVIKWNCRVHTKLNNEKKLWWGREIGSIIISFSFSQANVTLGINCESRPIYISEVVRKANITY